jgi:hypothetical protein
MSTGKPNVRSTVFTALFSAAKQVANGRTQLPTMPLSQLHWRHGIQVLEFEDEANRQGQALPLILLATRRVIVRTES